MVVPQILVNSLITGTIYSLLALSFSLIYRTNKFFNFSLGANITLSAYTLFYCLKNLQLNFVAASTIALIASVVFSYLSNRLFFKKFRKKRAPSVTFLIASFSLLVLIESTIALVFGTNITSLSHFPIAHGMNILSTRVTEFQIISIVFTALLFIVFTVFIKKTNIGKSIRAVADNPDLAETLGIYKEKILTTSFIISSFISGAAGIIIASDLNIEPSVGSHFMIKGFTGAVIGGSETIEGAIIGALLLSLVENISVWFLPAGYKEAVAFSLLFLFLLFKPRGLFGTRMEVEE